MDCQKEGANKLRALKLSAYAIGSVVLVEVSLGLIVGSLAIVSDGLHATLDLITTIALFVATVAALKPPDEEHLYGHEKFETIGGLIGGIVLVGVALVIFYEAALKSIQGVGVNQGLGLVGFGAIGFTFSIDVFRLAVFRKAGGDSSTVKVGFYHAIADLSSTVIAFIGFGLATLAGVSWGDSVASVALGVLLSYLSVGLIRNNIMELSDAASRGAVQEIRKLIISEPGVAKIENLRTRKVGSKTFVETTVQVAEGMDLEEAHGLASRIEASLKRTFGSVDATIHFEPNKDATRKEQLVERLAMVEGVREVHEVSTVFSSGKLYVTLHAIVDPKLSVEEAHKIAEEIEKNVHGGIPQLEHVTVHVEPSGEVRAVEVGDEELKTIISRVTDGLSESFRLEKVLTYVAGGRRYVNLDCCFTKRITINEAHRLASRVEKELKDRFEDTAVITVHIEPIC